MDIDNAQKCLAFILEFSIDSGENKGEITIVMKEKDHATYKPHISKIAITDKKHR